MITAFIDIVYDFFGKKMSERVYNRLYIIELIVYYCVLVFILVMVSHE
jgi:hypothetical protein